MTETQVNPDPFDDYITGIIKQIAIALHIPVNLLLKDYDNKKTTEIKP